MACIVILYAVLTFLISCISLVNGIIGGKEAKADTIEYMAAIYNGSPVACETCSGAVISDHYILTNADITKYNISEVFASVGAHNLQKHAVSMKVENIFTPPNYKMDPENNDFALVKTVNRIVSKPIDLPTEDFPNESNIAVKVSGYGMKLVKTISFIEKTNY